MKRQLILISIFCFALMTLHAQVTVEKRGMVSGSQSALVLKLKGTDPKFAESEWKEYTKSYGKLTKVKGSPESVIPGVHVRDIGQGDLVNVYSYAATAADGTDFIVWFDRSGTFLTSSDKDYPTAEEFLKSFAIKVKVDMIALDLEEQNKKLAKLESNYTKLQKENDNLHKTITDAQAKIDQAEIDIPLNERAQEAAKTDIETQKTAVESVKDNPDEYKAQQKLLSKAESNLTKLQKENDGLHKTVTDSKAKIKQAEADIVTNLDNQKSTEKEIEDQKTVIDLVQKKLDAAKAEKPTTSPRVD